MICGEFERDQQLLLDVAHFLMICGEFERDQQLLLDDMAELWGRRVVA